MGNASELPAGTGNGSDSLYYCHSVDNSFAVEECQWKQEATNRFS